MASKLYVGGIPYAYEDTDLKEMFSKYGDVVSTVVIKDKFSGRSKGFGFVELDSKEAADKAVEELHESELDGRKITVDHARPMRRDNDR